MCVSYMEYGRTHKHSLKRARQTHENIKNNQAQPAYSNKPHKKDSGLQVRLDQAVSCLKKGSSYTHGDSFKQMDPATTETAVGSSTTSMSCSGLGGPVVGCPAPRKIIAGTGAAVDLIGARDLHNKDKQRKTSEPVHFCTANGIIKADTIVQYYSSALGEKYLPMC